MTETAVPIRYPRRRVQRTCARWIGRLIFPLLTRTTITGRENFPKHGPLIVAGNHTAMIESALMIVYTPWQLEMMGSSDLPPPPLLDVLARFYGYTPINRGNVDRQALRKILHILKQGGIVGIFPEGGIWDPGTKPAKRGVAWLSQRAQAPILPIGFGGLEGAINAIFRLRRPHLHINVGRVIPSVTFRPGVSHKDCLHEAAQHVMAEIMRLVPQQDKAHHPTALDERFELQVSLQTAQGRNVPLPEPGIPHAAALCKMLYRPAIVRIYAKDLNLPVQALQHPGTVRNPQQVMQAIEPVLAYLDQRNPAFFTYRFGAREGNAMEAGLRELLHVARYAAEAGYTMTMSAVRRYRLEGSDSEIAESDPGQAHRW